MPFFTKCLLKNERRPECFEDDKSYLAKRAETA